jgi:REP element-mobilizing transposase RayT
MTKFKKIFRVESSRLKVWNYSQPWWYYVTINTKDHAEYFGKVENGKMKINDLGKIVESCWEEIPNHFESVELDYYMIMPNHVHGIIIINPIVETPDRASLRQPTLGIIINQFKGSVKRWANKNGYQYFSWQTRFYDRIIRNENELYNVRKYIYNNPLRREIERDENLEY